MLICISKVQTHKTSTLDFKQELFLANKTSKKVPKCVEIKLVMNHNDSGV